MSATSTTPSPQLTHHNTCIFILLHNPSINNGFSASITAEVTYWQHHTNELITIYITKSTQKSLINWTVVLLCHQPPANSWYITNAKEKPTHLRFWLGPLITRLLCAKPQWGKPPTLSWVGLSLVICSYFPGVWLNCNRGVFCCCTSTSSPLSTALPCYASIFLTGSSPAWGASYILQFFWCSAVMPRV